MLIKYHIVCYILFSFDDQRFLSLIFDECDMKNRRKFNYQSINLSFYGLTNLTSYLLHMNMDTLSRMAFSLDNEKR
jgi:hypothetical protein